MDNVEKPSKTKLQKMAPVGKVVDRGGNRLIPELFKLGPITVFPWGLSLSIAILLGTFIGIKLAGAIGIDVDRVLDLAIVLVVGGVVGARLFYVFIYEPAYYFREPLQILALWNGGMVYYGALIGGFITGTLYVVRKRLPFWKLSDVVAPPLALGYGIVRIGCFLNGCCYGTPTQSFLGVIFRYSGGTACPDPVPRYPTQIFSSLLGFLLFGLLMYLSKKKRFDGQVFLTFLILYSIGRIIIEYFRENLIVFGNITVSQLVSVLIIIPAVVFYLVRGREAKN